MRVLLCERNFSGHRSIYMSALAQVPDVEVFCFAPENPGVDVKHYIPYTASTQLTIKLYWQWILDMKDAVAKNNIDVVHILDGDSVRRFFGLGFGILGCKKLLITYHHFFDGKVSEWAYKGMCRGKHTTAVVHTKSVYDSFRNCGVKDVREISYPGFDFDSLSSKDVVESKHYFDLPLDVATIGIIGGLSDYKNIIPFLHSLNACKEQFCLFIAGRENGVTKQDIETAVHDYASKAVLEIRRLTDEEYKTAIAASDIIYCLYGKAFDGASGPLTDAVCAQKVILSCAHGSLGQITRENHLGYSVDCDNQAEIISQTSIALQHARDFVYDEKAMIYRDSLHPKYFMDKYRQLYLSGGAECC